MFWAAVIVIAGFIFIFVVREVRERKIQAIKEDTEKIITRDSIARVIHKQVMDSLAGWKKRVDDRIKADSIEVRKIRKQNDKLERAFRDIDISDRPRF